MAVTEGRGPTRRDAARLAGGAVLLGGLAVVGPIAPARAAGFTDTGGNPFRADIDWMASTGIARGWPDGTFRPLQPVRRDAMAAFIHRLAGSPPLAPASTPFTAFRDVPARDMFAPEIGWMKAQGISWGWIDGTYRPLTTIRRDAMAAFLHRLLDARLRRQGVRIDPDAVPGFRDVPASTLFAREIRWMRAAGITTGWPDGTFRPLGEVRRQDMAAFLHRAAELATRAR